MTTTEQPHTSPVPSPGSRRERTGRARTVAALLVVGTLLATLVPAILLPEPASAEPSWIDVPWTTVTYHNPGGLCYHLVEFPAADTEGTPYPEYRISTQSNAPGATGSVAVRRVPTEVNFAEITLGFTPPAGKHWYSMRSPRSPSGDPADCDEADAYFRQYTVVNYVQAWAEPDENQPPVASFTWTASSDDPLEVAFDGSGSSDDVGIVDYDWDFAGLGGANVAIPPPYVFPRAGTYPVTLTVTDGDGETDAVTEDVVVRGPVVVNSTADGVDTDPGDGACDTGGTVGGLPECTLRAAILEVNASAAAGRVTFDIAGAARIEPPSDLPAVATPVTIDGTTQDGGFVALMGPNDGMDTGRDGLVLKGGSSTVKGLAIGGFRVGLLLGGATGNVVTGNRIGTAADGVTAVPNTIGVVVQSDDTRVGGPDAADANVVAGNLGVQLALDSGTARNRVEGNRIGTDGPGARALGTGTGVLMRGRDSILTGNDISSEGPLELHNVGSYGVTMDTGDGTSPDGSGNEVSENRIGVAEPGTGRMSVGVSAFALGGDDLSDTKVSGNIIRTAENGVWIAGAGARKAVVSGNTVDGDLGGDRGDVGVYLDGAPEATISRNTITGFDVLGAGISGSQTAVVARRSDGGVNVALMTPNPAQDAGSGPVTGTKGSLDSNRVGPIGPVAPADAVAFGLAVFRGATDTTVDGGEVSGARVGVQLAGGSGLSVTGVTATGLGAAIAETTGFASSSPGAAIGADGRGNRAAAFATGIRTGASGVSVRDNTVVDGDVGLVVGAGADVAGNVVARNAGTGIVVTGAEVAVEGNTVGTDAAGATAAPNGGGIDVAVGGTGAMLTRNLVSGNTDYGVRVAATGVTLRHNTIGLDRAEDTPIPNGVGVAAGPGATNLAVGTADADSGNVIAGNTAGQILVAGTDTFSVQRNFLGTDRAAAKLFRSDGPAVLVTSGARAGTVRDNMVVGADGGIVVVDAQGVRVQDTTFVATSNVIDLRPPAGENPVGVTGAATANGGIPRPNLVSVSQSNLPVSKILVEMPAGGPYHVEVFETGTCRTAADVPAVATPRGGFNVAGGGTAQFFLPGTMPVDKGAAVTITDGAGNTSEMSECVAVAPLADVDGDGIPDAEEGNADGNGDGVPDYQQANVASLDTPGGKLSMAVPDGLKLRGVDALTPPAGLPAGVELPLGALDFKVDGLEPGGSTTVELRLPAGIDPTSWWQYAAPAAGTDPVWTEFDHDGDTGAEILPGRVLLHVTDGGRGDTDHAADGSFTDPGGPSRNVTPPAAATTTGLTSSPNPSPVGAAVVLTATVATETPGAGTPTGTVEFLDGTTPIGTAALVGGKATLEISTLAVGTHPITAVYHGDGSFSGSTSAVLGQVVEDEATCDPLPDVRRVAALAVLSDGGILGVDLTRTAPGRGGERWGGAVVYWDPARRVVIVSLVNTKTPIAAPLAGACRGAHVRIRALSGRRPGTLDLKVVDGTPDRVALTFPGVAPVDSAVRLGGVRVG